MNTAIIVAGGSGTRFKSSIPKQFLELHGKPVLMRSIEAFINYQFDLKIILVLPKEQINFWQSLCKRYDFNKTLSIVEGGNTRFHSVKNALDTIAYSQNLVAIHDGVRPLVSKNTLERCFNEAAHSGNAIPAILPNDSVRQINGDKTTVINRDTLRLIQTPQVFNTQQIKDAYKQKYHAGFTDDASVLSAQGTTINLVEGNRENIKITTEIDLLIAETLIKYQQSN